VEKKKEEIKEEIIKEKVEEIKEVQPPKEPTPPKDDKIELELRNKILEHEKKIEEYKDFEIGLKSKIEELTIENFELTDSVKQYQQTMETIIGKHRTLMVSFSSFFFFFSFLKILT